MQQQSLNQILKTKVIDITSETVPIFTINHYKNKLVIVSY